jgi:hypothetical protein
MLLALHSHSELQNLSPNAALTPLPKFRHTPNSKLSTNVEPLSSTAQPQPPTSHHLTFCTLQFYNPPKTKIKYSPEGPKPDPMDFLAINVSQKHA